MFEPEHIEVPWWAEHAMFFKEFFTRQHQDGRMPPVCLVGREDLPRYAILCTGAGGDRDAGLRVFWNLHQHVLYDSLIFVSDAYLKPVHVADQNPNLTREEIDEQIARQYPQGSLESQFKAEHEQSGITEMLFALKAEKLTLTAAAWLPYFHAQGNEQVLWLRSQFVHQEPLKAEDLGGIVPETLRKIVAQKPLSVEKLMEQAALERIKRKKRNWKNPSRRPPTLCVTPERAREIRETAVMEAAKNQGHTVLTSVVVRASTVGSFWPR